MKEFCNCVHVQVIKKVVYCKKYDCELAYRNPYRKNAVRHAKCLLDEFLEKGFEIERSIAYVLELEPTFEELKQFIILLRDKRR